MSIGRLALWAVMIIGATLISMYLESNYKFEGTKLKKIDHE